MTEKELEPIAELLLQTDVMVIADEIYAELTYHGKHASIAAHDGMWERTIVINGFSKAFAMTGWRLGFVCAPTELLEIMLKIHQYTMLCAPIMSQEAALGADAPRVQPPAQGHRGRVQGYGLCLLRAAGRVLRIPVGGEHGHDRGPVLRRASDVQTGGLRALDGVRAVQRFHALLLRDVAG